MKLICPACKEKSENVQYKVVGGKIELQCPSCHKDFKRPLPPKMTLKEITPEPIPIEAEPEKEERKRSRVSVGEDRSLSQAVRSWVRSGPMPVSDFMN